jgi:hypothetical protein
LPRKETRQEAPGSNSQDREAPDGGLSGAKSICYDPAVPGRDRRVRKFAFAVILALVPVEASAIVRYMVQGMTCAEVQNSVDRDGVAILYRQASKSGVPLYDRYVANGSFCQAGQDTIKESVPTADTQNCRVSKCLDGTRFGGNNR